MTSQQTWMTDSEPDADMSSDAYPSPRSSQACGRDTDEANEEEISSDPRGDSLPVFRCSICPQCYSSIDSLTEHINSMHSHDGVNKSKEEYQCPKCSRVFNRKSKLNTHMSDQHPGQVETDVEETDGVNKSKEEYQCPKCSRVFNRKSKLNTHMSEKHPEPGQVETDGNETDDELHRNKGKHDRRGKRKMQVNDEPLPTFKCPICHRLFSRKSDQTKHMKKHQEPEEEGGHSGRGLKRATAPGSSNEFTISTRSVTNETAVAVHVHENPGNNVQEDGSGPVRHEIQPTSTGKRYKNIREMHGDKCNQGTEEGSSGLVEEELPDANADQCTESLNSHSSGQCDSPMPMHHERHQTEIIADHDNVPSTSAGPAVIQRKRRSESINPQCTLNDHIEYEHSENPIDGVADVAIMTKTDQVSLCCRFCNKEWLEVLHDHERECVKIKYTHGLFH